MRNVGKINFKRNLKVYWELLKEHKFVVIGLIIMLFLTQATNVLEKYLLKILVDNGTQYAEGTLPKDLFIHVIIIIAITFFGIQAFNAIAKWLRIHLSSISVSTMMKSLKERYFNHIMRLDHNFHVTHKTGSLISKLVRAGSAIERLNDSFEFNFLPFIFQAGTIFVTLIYLSIHSAIALLISTIAFISYSFYVQKKQEPASINVTTAEDQEKARISDFFMNIDSIKYFGKENLISKYFNKITTHTKQLLMKYWGYYRWMDTGQQIILAVGTFFVVYFPIKQFLANEISIGTLVFIYSAYAGMTGSLHGFVGGVRNYYRSMADLQPLFDYGEIQNAIVDLPHAPKITITKGDIHFNNIGFKYHQRSIFKEFNLNIKKNQKVALVGHSGSGKSTLIKLLYRFYDVNEGAILIDNKDIRNFNQESLRGELSIVPQECILFDDSIYNNIAFSNPKAKKEEVWKAIRFAQLEELIKELPYKENTIVGERGVKLSGGEKQRVSIARALLANKKILVLDEATSSLDSETEHQIQEALHKLMKGRTTIIIAHRLSTIMHADKIIVMKHGRILQEGPHEKLIREEGEYHKLWKLQKGGYIK